MAPDYININNFFVASLGTWDEINEIPEGFTLFHSTRDSRYFKNKDETILIRISDHWGSGIRECNWYLKGYARYNSFLFKKNQNGKSKIGIIELSQLRDLRILEIIK